jgi:alginate O-acetyltransferase complex protein AlgJ
MSEFARDHLKPSRLELRSGGRGLPGAFFLGCLALGVPLALWSPESRAMPKDKAVQNGTWAQAFERTLDRQLPLRDLSVGFWATLNYRLFQEGRPGVLVGQGGWLYTSEEFELSPQAPQEMARKLAYIRQVDQRLKAQGAALVLALVPEKARLYPEHLGRYILPAAHQPVYAQFVTQLQQAGVMTADVLGAMQRSKAVGPQFLRTDTHWTPLGAQTAAQEIARTLRAAALRLPPRTFRTVAQPATPYRGDLLRYLPLSTELSPAPELVQPRRTQPADAAQSSDLLGDDRIPVALVGTSYSANPTWNFAGELQQALGADVLNAAKEGKGPVIPMREYLSSQAFLDNPPQVVVWEVPERFLAVTSLQGASQ